jgi:uncharacterized OB-fold protein
MTESTRPVPVPDADDAFFWAHLEEGLELPHCRNCSLIWLRPCPSCPRCGSTDLDTIIPTGDGVVYSWVGIERALDPTFRDDAPYTVVVAEMNYGTRINGRWLGAAPPRAGEPVEFVVWHSGGAAVPGFRPTTDSEH